jgi:PKD repeat protein
MIKTNKISFLLFFLLIYNHINGQLSFNPTNISGIKIWLKSDTGLIINSGRITEWKDISGNNFIFSQITYSAMPYLQVSQQFENKTPIHFDGNSKLESTTNFSFSNISVFMVASQSSGEAVYGRFIDHDFGSGFWFGRNNNNDDIGGGFTESVAPYGNFQPVQNDVPFVFSNIRVGATNFSYFNTTSFSLPSRTTTSLNTSLNPISIGASISNAFFGKKNIYEILIYNRDLTNLEQQQIENYLLQKYSAPVSLGPDILTCNLPITLKASKKNLKSYSWQDNSTLDSFVVNSSGTYYVNTVDVFGKNSSDTIIVTQDFTPKSVNLGNDTSFCNGDSLVLYAGPNHLTYSWANNGSTTNTLVVKTSGVYSVTVTDCLGNVTSDEIEITVNPLPIFSLGPDRFFCFNKDTILIASNALAASYIWQDLTTNDTIKVVRSGVYSATITSLNGCKYKDNVSISIDSSLFNTSLGPDLNRCAGNSITLVSGYSSSHSYLWNTGSTNDSLLINLSGQYSVIVTNTNNCVAKDTINVNVVGFAPIANFTTSVGCINSIVNFTDLSVPPLGNTLTAYEWNFGDLGSATNTSTLSNPSHTYTNTGTYTISLKVISNTSCEQTIRKIIQVFPKPTVNFTSGLSCQNDSTTFSSLCTSVSGYSISSLNWNFGDPTSTSNTSNLVFPKHLFSNQTNYTIKLVATNNVGCKDSLINIITVKPQVKADFIISSPCANNATFFQDNSIVPPAPSSNIRIWNFGNGPINSLNASKTYTSSGVYSVTLTVNSSNQCSSTIRKLVTIFSRPTASFSIPTFCAKDTITVTNLSVAQSGIISLFDWKLNNSNFSSIQSPSLSISNAGNYAVRLTVTNSFGCKDSISNSVTINPLPNIDFVTNPSTYYYINSPIIFIPSITNASSYLWNLTSIGTTTIQSPTVTYNNEGTYTVSLNIKDQQGCKNSITKTIFASKRFLDAAILNVSSSKDNDGFMTIQTDIANYGSIPVSTLDLSYRISDGGNIKEKWYGTLNPNSFFSYTFVSKTATQIGSSNNMTCIDIEKINGINDENQSNNELCNILNTNEITVSNPIPNPSNADITLPVILNKEIDISISIFNSNGQIQYQEKIQRGIVGLNLVTLPTDNYQRGCYIIKTVIDDEVFIKKFIKISNE